MILKKLLKKVGPFQSKLVLGHSRLITNSLKDNQPVIRNDLFVIHNGIIINDDEIWTELGLNRQTSLDSEAIVGILEAELAKKLAWSLFLDKFFLNAKVLSQQLLDCQSSAN